MEKDRKRKRESFSVEKKREILADAEENLLKKSEIAQKYGIAKSTLSTILKQKDKLESSSFLPARLMQK